MQTRLLSHGVGQVDAPDAFVWHYVPEERSTLQWLVRRKVRGGRQRGQTKRGQEGELSEAIRLAMRCAASTVKQTLLANRAGRWQAFLALCYWYGVLRGHLQRSSEDAQ